MTNEEMQKNKKVFQQLCKEFIKREGILELLEYLDTTDFYVAPTSTNYHLNEPGGLCKHSINVFQTACGLYDAIFAPALKEKRACFTKEITMESIAIATLFHDLCKVGLYHQPERFKKDENTRWVTYLGYEINDNFPLGHGEKSCLLLHSYMKLTKEEMLAIRWHMGAFDLGEQGSSNRFSFYKALELSPLVTLVHASDFLSSNCLEPTRNWKDLIIRYS